MLDSETSAVVQHDDGDDGRASTGATMRLDQSDSSVPTDEEIIAAIPLVSRKLYGHDGGGVDPYELALHLAPKPGCYGVASDEVLAHVIKRLRAMARVGRVRKGSYHGRPFYRVGV